MKEIPPISADLHKAAAIGGGACWEHSILKWASVFFAVLCLIAAPAHAQSPATFPVASQPADHLKVFLLTFGPGSDPWEKFGHDAIVIEDSAADTALAYNWGVFDFGEGVSGFVSFGWHFVQGRLWYAMESEPADDMVATYIQANRSILIQKLNLTPAQKLDLQARLIANDTDANRHYLYDYFKKNCATMTRDAIDQTIGGRARETLGKIPTATTYRWHDRRDTADVLWLYLFLDFALGHPVDRPLSQWQECFLPGKLAEHLVNVQVPDAQGKLVPLIGDSRQLNAGIYPERKVPPASYVYWLLVFGVSAGAVLAFLGYIGRRRKLARWAFNLFAVIWSLLAGALGALSTFIWFSNHDAAKWNENWFQINPISLLLVVLIPAAWRWPIAAKRVAFTVSGLALFGLLVKLTPCGWQANGPIMAIALPLHAGVAWGMAQLVQSARPEIKSGN